jgi:hypothetical protein
MDIVSTIAIILILALISVMLVCIKLYKKTRNLISHETASWRDFQATATQTTPKAKIENGTSEKRPYVKRKAFKYVSGRRTNYFAQKRFLEGE